MVACRPVRAVRADSIGGINNVADTRGGVAVTARVKEVKSSYIYAEVVVMPVPSPGMERNSFG